VHRRLREPFLRRQRRLETSNGQLRQTKLLFSDFVCLHRGSQPSTQLDNLRPSILKANAEWLVWLVVVCLAVSVDCAVGNVDEVLHRPRNTRLEHILGRGGCGLWCGTSVDVHLLSGLYATVLR